MSVSETCTRKKTDLNRREVNSRKIRKVSEKIKIWTQYPS